MLMLTVSLTLFAVVLEACKLSRAKCLEGREDDELLSSMFFDDLVTELGEHALKGCETCVDLVRDRRPDFKCLGCHRVVRREISRHAWEGCAVCQGYVQRFHAYVNVLKVKRGGV